MLQIFMSSLQHSKSRHDSLKYYNKVSSLMLSVANQQLNCNNSFHVHFIRSRSLDRKQQSITV